MATRETTSGAKDGVDGPIASVLRSIGAEVAVDAMTETCFYYNSIEQHITKKPFTKTTQQECEWKDREGVIGRQ